MSRSLKYDIPGTDWRRSVTEVAEKGCLALFEPDLSPPFDLVVEIGFGRGEFLLELAAAEPGSAFMGIEVSFKRTLKLARKLARSGMTNVRIVETRAELAVAELLPDAAVREIWINFSDPWPKDRHARRRLIQPAFVQAAAHRLKSGGLLHVATDDVPYARQIDEVLRGEPSLRNAFAPEPFLPEVPGRMHTGYEDEWRSEGRPLHFFCYQRRERPEDA